MIKQMLFLDIDMPGLDGIDIANKLRQSEDDVFIIFITNRRNGFSIHTI